MLFRSRERTRRLREISEKKNRDFRRGMLGKTLPAVPLEERGWALSSDFLKIRMNEARAPNRLVDLDIGGVTDAGLRDRSALAVL